MNCENCENYKPKQERLFASGSLEKIKEMLALSCLDIHCSDCAYGLKGICLKVRLRNCIREAEK